MARLNINGKTLNLDIDGEKPLLWALREEAGLTGTKYGCDVGVCGACLVHIDDVAVKACAVAVGSLGPQQKIVTIEGLSTDASHPVQKAWLELNVAQCGYCQSGMIMAAAALLKAKPAPTDADIDAAMSNICRCGTYQRIRAAIHAAAQGAGKKPPKQE
ncbi:MAG: 2Fe-2S iron-sulfur cluster-binding protein [Hyphomicrobiaceae bacterium]